MGVFKNFAYQFINESSSTTELKIKFEYTVELHDEAKIAIQPLPQEILAILRQAWNNLRLSSERYKNLSFVEKISCRFVRGERKYNKLRRDYLVAKEYYLTELAKVEIYALQYMERFISELQKSVVDIDPIKIHANIKAEIETTIMKLKSLRQLSEKVKTKPFVKVQFSQDGEAQISIDKSLADLSVHEGQQFRTIFTRTSEQLQNDEVVN